MCLCSTPVNNQWEQTENEASVVAGCCERVHACSMTAALHVHVIAITSVSGVQSISCAVWLAFECDQHRSSSSSVAAETTTASNRPRSSFMTHSVHPYKHLPSKIELNLETTALDVELISWRIRNDPRYGKKRKMCEYSEEVLHVSAELLPHTWFPLAQPANSRVPHSYVGLSGPCLQAEWLQLGCDLPVSCRQEGQWLLVCSAILFHVILKGKFLFFLLICWGAFFSS